MDGFSTAFSEITLVLFTTLAPSGALAYALLNLPVLFGQADEKEHRALDRFSCLPLAIAMVGLIASATHLGNPSNALYVFTGVGRSPLSTEVFCAVVFLFLAGVYWLYSFAVAPRRGLQRVLVVCIDAAAVAFVVATAYAYNVDTILTWSLPLVPVSLMANALLGGPVLALLSFAAAGLCAGIRAKSLLAVSAVALVVNIGVYAALGAQLLGISNELAAVAELTAPYPVCLVTFAVLGGAGIALAWRSRALRGRSLVRRMVAASILVLAGIFLMRFTFYMSHLTVGLGV
ncbi:DmsC/YnfH family molybdoenzyme membrane anchor subunit [Adlercreutzia sp. R21]|uniref:dimethyl sulfoxide reductase anchor subunit family protein n=1 Tax=Adlercreutzia wanghongyangiae TaxID=3111451 RepID=UPI002DBAFAC0|nr:DmsC/YnfH family molybdoenzyme membrane anchor subunit [Adlercreutzia sp. R21]MEC4183617.1 DmsC/YnfH family molybdoenzyme membrane anchor subunit [Adlercreutzia sp. R21]